MNRQPRFNGVELSAATIDRTRSHFADIGRRCIAEARDGTTRVNDLARYVAWREAGIADDLAGRNDHSFTFLQRAHWIQTGDCVLLLARPESRR
jgi:hypothetical protein